MTQSAGKKIGIVGAGLSGLSTAVHLRLADPSLQISVLESSDRCGGVIQTEVTDRFVVDYGADMFASNPGAALELCQQIGVNGDLIHPQQEGRGAMIVRQGRPVPIPDGFVLMRATKLRPMLTTPILSPAGKTRLLFERWAGSNPSADESVGDFVRRRMGQEVLDRIVAPLVAGIYTADIDKLSMQATMAPIHKMVQQHGSLAKATAMRKRAGEDSDERLSSGARYNQFRSFPQGMHQLIRTLVDFLPEGTITKNAPVSSLTRDEATRSWRVEAESRSYSFDQIVIATPAKAASKLLQGVSADAANQLGSIESSSTAMIVLAVKKQDIKRPVNTFGFVVPIGEGRNVLAVSFASHKFAHRAPDDHVLIRVFVGGSLQPHLLQRDDGELVDMVQSELQDLIGYNGQPTLTRVIRWNNSMPQYHVGHLERVASIKSAIAAQDGLHLVTNALDGVGIAPVIRSAAETAQNIIDVGAKNEN